MKANASILMYSGMQNPGKELTDQETAELKKLVEGLEIPYSGPSHSRLGFSGYAASFDCNHVIADLYGFVKIYNALGEETVYSDTTGVLAYLCKLLTPVMIKHQEDAKKAMEDYMIGLRNL